MKTKYFTLMQLSKRWKKHRVTLRRWCDSGKLKGKLVCARWIVSEKDVQKIDKEIKKLLENIE